MRIFSRQTVDCVLPPVFGRLLRSVTAVPIPVLVTFTVGSNIARCEKQTKNYLDNFPSECRGCTLLSLLVESAFDTVSEAGAVGRTVPEDPFTQLWRLMNSPLVPMEYRKQFTSCHQKDDKDIRTFAREIRRLAERASPNISSEGGGDDRKLEQLVEGARTPNVQKKLLSPSPQRTYKVLWIGLKNQDESMLQQ
ncbi:hypothetical protein FGIG_10129 [Fasciola gigantica]|uniref:Uncharacterized protein n=1 Tax=Fasciola gigantica TaxID=46835 RepID=A0A504YUW2_FASGI|nr:hypothetical protein FGIG_10129 [Fasciola gigantica]